MEMLFERFISRERNEPPDIDVDFEHERREEVIQYIYAQIRPRTRRARRHCDHAIARRARCATSARRWASTSRRSTGWRILAWWDGRQVLPERLREAGFDPEAADRGVC